jgi:hypothetical protein
MSDPIDGGQLRTIDDVKFEMDRSDQGIADTLGSVGASLADTQTDLARPIGTLDARKVGHCSLYRRRPIPARVVFLAKQRLLRAGSYPGAAGYMGNPAHAPAGQPSCTVSVRIGALGYSGLAISLWPNIIPPSISIWDAASPPESMGFTLVGALFIIPFILAYTTWSYYVFRGKVRTGEGYH